MTRALAPRRLAVALAIGMVVSGAAAVLDNVVFNPPSSPPVVAQPIAPAPVPEPLVDTDIAQTRQALGPFETIVVSSDTPTPETRHPAVLILNEDGSTEASTAWTVRFDSTSWTEEDVFQIKSLSTELGYVTIGSGNGRTFVVRANQPFIFGSQPDKVIAVTLQGQTHVLNMSRAQASRQPI